MLFGLIVMMGCTGSLMAKEGLRPIPSAKGCPVDDPCHGGFDHPTDSKRDNVVSRKDEDPHYKVPMRDETPYHEVVVFVSFSMPEASLKALSEAVPQHKAVLVMRGLYEDSFVKTSAKLQQMGVMVDIHPDLFEQYHIERVPVFVKLKQGREVARLSGNVSLAFAVSKLDETS